MFGRALITSVLRYLHINTGLLMAPAESQILKVQKSDAVPLNEVLRLAVRDTPVRRCFRSRPVGHGTRDRLHWRLVSVVTYSTIFMRLSMGRLRISAVPAGFSQ